MKLTGLIQNSKDNVGQASSDMFGLKLVVVYFTLKIVQFSGGSLL